MILFSTDISGSRLLLLDIPGNIHSISHLFNPLTSSYLDVFATLPPIIPSGPIAILGFGAGSAARLILNLYPKTIIHGYHCLLDIITSLISLDIYAIAYRLWDIITNLPFGITIYRYELDPSVISVAREFFGLFKLEKQYRNQISISVSDAIEAIPTMADGFYSGTIIFFK